MFKYIQNYLLVFRRFFLLRLFLLRVLFFLRLLAFLPPFFSSSLSTGQLPSTILSLHIIPRIEMTVLTNFDKEDHQDTNLFLLMNLVF